MGRQPLGSLRTQFFTTIPLVMAIVCDPAAAQSTAEDKPVTIYLVRHAEKQEPASNPDSETPLNTEGQARADTLARLLSNCQITVVYTTPYKRTIDTARPLVEEKTLSDSPVVVPPRELSALPDRIRRSGASAVLVVGHSNTVPANVRALAAREDAVPNIADDAFHDLLVVTVTRWKPREAVVKHYRFGKLNASGSSSALPEFHGCGN